MNSHPRAHNAYLSPSRTGDTYGQFEVAQRRQQARDGSARLLRALLRYFERRAAA